MRVQIPPPHIPFLDAGGMVSRPWYRFMSDVAGALGGYNGPTFETVDATTLRATVLAPDGSEAHVDLTVTP